MPREKAKLLLSFRGGPWDGGALSLDCMTPDVDIPRQLWVERRDYVFEGRKFIECDIRYLHSHPVEGVEYRAVKKVRGELHAAAIYRVA